MFRSHHFELDGRRLHCAVGPAHGPPLVLLHGVLRCWRDFAPLLSSLSARHQLYALDFRGHGQSAPCPGGYLVNDYVEDACALIQRELTGPVDVFGHSLGAMAAAAVAGRCPDRVRAVILEDPPFGTMGAGIGATPFHQYFTGVQQLVRGGGDAISFAKGLSTMVVADGDHVKPIVRLGDLRDASSLRFSGKCLEQIDPEVLDPIVDGRWLKGYDSRRVLDECTVPTLLLQADSKAGGMLRREEAEAATQRMRDCLLVKLGGVGHLIHWMRTDATLRLAHGFLESL